MITYIIRSTTCALLFLLVYRILLQREKMYVFNRVYLLASLLTSLIIPLFTFSITADTPAPVESLYLPSNIFEPPATSTPPQAATTAPLSQSTLFTWTNLFIALYTLVALILFIRFLRNLFLLQRIASRNQQSFYQGARLILLDSDTPAYSFLGSIFMSKGDYDDPGARDALLTHELLHVRQKHSWDILLIEILRVVYWFNPLLPFYKKAMQFNHELLADNSVITKLGNVRSYQHLLLEKLEMQGRVPLASSFNYLITKKRLTMMTTTPNMKRIILLQLASLPVLLVSITLFSDRTYAQAPQKASPQEQTVAWTKTYDAKGDTAPRIVKYVWSNNVPPPGPGASVEQLEQFEKLFGKDAIDGTQRKSSKLSQEEVATIKSIYSAMNQDQRASYPPLIFTKPPGPKTPTASQLQSWTDAKTYGLWIDGKRVNNEVLARHEPGDFAYFSSSKLAKNAVNYGKHYVQVDLYTQEHYKNVFGKNPEMLIILQTRAAKNVPSTK
ncbi:M56 family metallopeptidase [Paraflavitalea sp. CAU 1676]|uniref:M56 family metallopeptidase n=1 Tax=Paraflavitalea sp. CAU 1676 TaxID=3032598 RepID=UPI0023DB1268|nr:M56 family metallopeptidase [Paraflavitalea sp. CAU 1676]MDF2189813.1 M56 family metallopeptidase [Paraflavitalea sp. CAU 1676]